MALQAHLDLKRHPRDGRSQARRKLRLLTEARSARGGAVDVLILDISTTGLLVQADLPLEQDETIEIELPGTGLHVARIVWSGDRFFGCAFEAPIPPAAVSAALLKGLPGNSGTSDKAAGPLPPPDFGRRLASLRNERGWSIEEVAAHLGVSRQAVWYWETGQRVPRQRLFKRVAEIFEVPPEALKAEAVNPQPAEAISLIEELRARIAARIGCDKEKITISIQL